jgi:hypothetical protein
MNTNEELITAFLKNAPHIKEYSIDIDLEEYHKSDDKSYIYEWINLKNLKIHEDTGKKLKIYYDGYNSERQCLPHEASDIPYFHSSENKDFLDDLSDPTGEWKLRIRSIGKADVMQCEEWLILTAADEGLGAAKSKLYYNNHNGGIMKKTEKLDKVKCDVIVKQFKDCHFPINIEDKELHRKMPNFQPRVVTDPDWILEIKDLVNAAGGNISLTDPTIVFEGLGEDGEDKAGGGIHTKFGVLNSSSTKIKVQRLPYEIGKTLTSSEIRYICNQFNKRPQVRKKYIDPETVVKEMVDGYIDDGIEPDDSIWPTVIKSHGFVKTKTIIESATADIDEIKQGTQDAKAGKVRKRYDKSKFQGGHKEELDVILKRHTTGTTLAVGFASGAALAVPIRIIDKIDTNMVELDLKSIPIKKIEVFMYHTQAKHKKKWLSEHRANLEKRMKFIFDDKKIEFDIDMQLEEFEYQTLEETNKMKVVA